MPSSRTQIHSMPRRAQCQIKIALFPIDRRRPALIGSSICRIPPASGISDGSLTMRLFGPCRPASGRAQHTSSGELKWPRDKCAAIGKRKNPRKTIPNPQHRLCPLAARRESRRFRRRSRSRPTRSGTRHLPGKTFGHGSSDWHRSWIALAVTKFLSR